MIIIPPTNRFTFIWAVVGDWEEQDYHLRVAPDGGVYLNESTQEQLNRIERALNKLLAEKG